MLLAALLAVGLSVAVAGIGAADTAGDDPLDPPADVQINDDAPMNCPAVSPIWEICNGDVEGAVDVVVGNYDDQLPDE